MKILILGSRGFIGSALATHLKHLGHEISCAEPSDLPNLPGTFDVLIYAIGMTANFRKNFNRTINAHINILVDVVEWNKFRHLIYLSSTRLYSNNLSSGESTDVRISGLNKDDFYNASKILGEMYSLHECNQPVSVLRLSNVIGNDYRSENFLTSAVREAKYTGHLELRSNKNVEKDFILLEDVLEVVARVIYQPVGGVLNVASGTNLKLYKIAKIVSSLTGARLSCREVGAGTGFPSIDITKLTEIYNFHPQSVESKLEKIVKALIDDIR